MTDAFENTYNTYKGWKDIGYIVRVGQISTIFNQDKEALFSFEQTSTIPIEDIPIPTKRDTKTDKIKQYFKSIRGGISL